MIKLVKKNDSVSLVTGGVPQSEINDLLAAQEERLNKIHEEEVFNLNTVISGLEFEVIDLKEDVNDLTDTNTKLNEQIVDLSGEVIVLNGTITELNDEIDELEAIVNDMPTPVEGVKF